MPDISILINRDSSISYNLQNITFANSDYGTIITVINGLSLRTPWASTCLVKVLAAHKMLTKHKILHSVHFGVRRSLSSGMQAHAWLSIGSKIVIGGNTVSDFQQLTLKNYNTCSTSI
jgi:hypothetical protein